MFLAWDDLTQLLDENAATWPLAASSLYAIAALDLGMAYVNFTPSTGAHFRQLASSRSSAKLATPARTARPAKRFSRVCWRRCSPPAISKCMSWVGHNIFGNMDGQILDNPANKAAKIEGKDQLIGRILGYDPQTLVSIEYIRSLGDWKTAWDHIHFRGFLGTPMTLQFTWQGCDSLLAAPLVLDLVRFVELSQRRGEVGCSAILVVFSNARSASTTTLSPANSHY